MPDLEKLKQKVDKAKASVARCKAKLYEAETDQDKVKCERALKAAKTRLANARILYKAAKPSVREKVNGAKKKVKKTMKKGKFKRVATWTGVAVKTVATGICGFFLYNYLNGREEKISRDTV